MYINPGGNMTEPWKKIDLGLNADAILMMDVDGDAYADVIAQALPDVYWLEAEAEDLASWKAKKVVKIPATSHVNSQGFEKADIFRGNHEEILIAGDGDIYSIEIPSRPDRQDWKVVLIGENLSNECIGYGDINGDGFTDTAAGRRAEGEDEPTQLIWWQHSGKQAGHWKAS